MRNKTNVQYKRVSYNENNNVTKCELTFEVDVNKYPINDLRLDNNVLIKIAQEAGCEYIQTDNRTGYPNSIGFKVTAQAKCNTEVDEYNNVTGRHIALSRAQAKAFARTCELYYLLTIQLTKSIGSVTRLIDNNWSAANKCWEHAKKLGNY